MSSKSKPDFKGAVNKIKKARNLNVVLCCVIIVAALAVAVALAFTQYRIFGLMTGIIVAAAATALLLKNMNEAAAATAVAKHSVYAALVSRDEMAAIRKHQNRRGQHFYFTAMLVLLVPEFIVLTVLYFVTKSSVYLLFMAGFALACLLVTLFSALYLNARLSAQNAVCLVSGRGIIIGREILPFNAAKGETLLLFRFNDFYCLRFVKTAVFGIKYESDVIFPVDGALRAGLDGSCDEELTEALHLDGVFATEDAFYESRDYLAETGVENEEDLAPMDDIVDDIQE